MRSMLGRSRRHTRAARSTRGHGLTSWTEYLAEANGLCVFARADGQRDVATAIELLSSTGEAESDPIRYDSASGSLTIRVRLMRGNGARVDPMLEGAVAWALDSVSPDDDTRMKVLTSFRLSRSVLGIVADPPLVEEADERLDTLRDVAREVNGLLFNGFGIRTPEGNELAWRR